MCTYLKSSAITIIGMKPQFLQTVCVHILDFGLCKAPRSLILLSAPKRQLAGLKMRDLWPGDKTQDQWSWWGRLHAEIPC